MFAILFGLSMDYNVFLQSRIREEYLKGATPEESVDPALARVGRIILAAGAIMTSVFLGFVGDPDVVVKMIGVGLACAILIDVLIVRMVVAPAVMTLLGDRAWGLPAWLDRALPRSRSRATSIGPPQRRRRARPPPSPPDARARFGPMAEFAPFDTRGYRMVDARTGLRRVGRHLRGHRRGRDGHRAARPAAGGWTVRRGRRSRLWHRPDRRPGWRSGASPRSTGST